VDLEMLGGSGAEKTSAEELGELGRTLNVHQIRSEAEGRQLLQVAELVWQGPELCPATYD